MVEVKKEVQATQADTVAKPVKKSKMKMFLTFLMYGWMLVLLVIMALVIFISVMVGKCNAG